MTQKHTSPTHKEKLKDSALNLPSLEIEALQAELALEKLSKEIVFLRNQQRESLIQRRKEVLQKKQRAEERRKAHAQEVVTLRQSQERLMADLREARSTNETLTISLQTAHEGKLLVDQQLQDSAATIQSQRSQITTLRDTIDRLEASLETEKKTYADNEAAWMNEKATLERCLLASQCDLSALTKQMNAMETRCVFVTLRITVSLFITIIT